MRPVLCENRKEATAAFRVLGQHERRQPSGLRLMTNWISIGHSIGFALFCSRLVSPGVLRAEGLEGSCYGRKFILQIGAITVVNTHKVRENCMYFLYMNQRPGASL